MKSGTLAHLSVLLLLLVAPRSWAQAGEELCVDPEDSVFRILVGKSGLFGVFGHDHVIEAQDIDGCGVVDPAGAAGSVTLHFPAARLRVIDPDASAEDRNDVQQKMEEDVLEIERYPEILFQSTGIEAGSRADAFQVTGDLTIHGATRAVTIPVTLSVADDGSYQITGEYSFRQTTFDIEPVRLFGGTVRVKDEIRVEFSLSMKKPSG